TRGQELFIVDVPFIDSLSFVFLAYAAYCLARAGLAQRGVPRWVMAVAAGVLMRGLVIVIGPLAVRGVPWFLAPPFGSAQPGIYFGGPLSNFAGWVIVGTVGVGLFLTLGKDYSGRRIWPGVALYYAVLGFNLTMTLQIGELLLALIGATIHLVFAVSV